MTTTEKILILGHSGFIGSALERRFAALQRREVVGRSLPELDLTNADEAAQLAPFLTLQTTVILAAAVKRQFGDNLDVYDQNMAIVENLSRLIRAHPVKRVVFMSSTAVYGEETENTRITEATAANPTSYYGIAKFSAECLLRKLAAEDGQLSLICLRPPLIYGPGDPGLSYGPAGFCAAALRQTSITLWGDGTELREFIFIDDLFRIIAALIDSEFSGALNVVSGTRYCFADIVTLLRARFPALEVNARPRSKPKADHAFDPSTIRSLLPREFTFTPLAEGIARTLAVA